MPCSSECILGAANRQSACGEQSSGNKYTVNSQRRRIYNQSASSKVGATSSHLPARTRSNTQSGSCKESYSSLAVVRIPITERRDPQILRSRISQPEGADNTLTQSLSHATNQPTEHSQNNSVNYLATRPLHSPIQSLTPLNLSAYLHVKWLSKSKIARLIGDHRELGLGINISTFINTAAQVCCLGAVASERQYSGIRVSSVVEKLVR